MRSKDDYKSARLVVKRVIDSWDPYALLEGGAPDDEFSEEVDQLVLRLPRIRSAADAAKAVSEVMSSAFDADDFTHEKCADVGERLYARCKEAGFIR